MKTLLSFLFCIQIGSSIQVFAQSKLIFDPLMDTIACQNDGIWEIKIPLATLTRSAQKTFPELDAVKKGTIKIIKSKVYLVLEGTKKDSLEISYHVAIQLREAVENRWMASDLVQICIGAPCNACGFTQTGCLCESYYNPNKPLEMGNCNNIATKNLLLAPVQRE